MYEVMVSPERAAVQFKDRAAAFSFIKRVSQKKGWAGMLDSITRERWIYCDGKNVSFHSPGTAK